MFKYLNKAEEFILSVILVFMVILVFANSMAEFAHKLSVRYLDESSSITVFITDFVLKFNWSEPFTLILSGWLVLIGASYCIREKAHITVELFTDKLDGVAEKAVTLLALLACLAYAGIFLYGSIPVFWQDYQLKFENENIAVENWKFNIILVLGFGLIILRFLETIYRVIIQNDTSVLRHIGEVKESMELAESVKSLQEDSKSSSLSN